MFASRPRPAHGAGGGPGRPRDLRPPGILPLCQLMGCGWGVGIWHVGAGGRKLPFRALTRAKSMLLAQAKFRRKHIPAVYKRQWASGQHVCICCRIFGLDCTVPCLEAGWCSDIRALDPPGDLGSFEPRGDSGSFHEKVVLSLIGNGWCFEGWQLLAVACFSSRPFFASSFSYELLYTWDSSLSPQELT
jgi:hypothetical protein